MDPIDDLFAAMHVREALYARLEAGAPWGVDLAPGSSVRFGLVVRGRCRMEVEGEPCVELEEGDCYVLPHGTGYVLRDAPLSPTVACSALVRDNLNGIVRVGGSGTAATLLCGWFQLDASAAAPLLDLLPLTLHARMDPGRTRALQGTLELLALETAQPGLGSALVVDRLAGILFVQAVRAHVAALGPDESGWLHALADARLGAALRAMHRDIARPWTVESLAERALMSRSAFAMRFRSCVGQPPLEYLTRWRMVQAGRLLRHDKLSLGQVAERVGYESEAAFSKAFKRTLGRTPGAFRAQFQR